MTDHITDIATYDLPFRRQARLKRVDFDSGLSMVRLIIKEGTRITQVDLDAASATQLGKALTAAGDTL